MVPALVLGTAAGFTGGVWAAGSLDTTPYGETDLNTASHDARQAGQAEGLQKAQQVTERTAARLRSVHDDRIGLLEGKLAQARTDQKRATKKAEKEAEEQRTRLARLQSSLAETTAALRNATGGGAGDGQAVEGKLRVTWTLGPKDQPWPQDCAEAMRTYQVRVVAGADATVATAKVVDAEVVRSTVRPDVETDSKTKGKADSQAGDGPKAKPDATRETATLVCALTYTTKLPTPLGDGYRFEVSASAEPDVTLENKPASRSALGKGSGPLLWVSGVPDRGRN